MAALTKKQLEDIVTGLNGRLDGLLAKITSLESLPARIANMEALLEASNAENAGLRKALEFKDSQINSLLLKTNSLEQYNRSWSIRVNGLAISSEEEKDSFLVKQKVYDNLLLPILTAAVDNGDLHSVPRVDDLLEAAHILPARDNKAKPVIARFFTRDMRSLVFRFKKEFAPRVREEPGLLADDRRPAADSPGRYRYPFFEDLTSVNFKKMRAIADHQSVEACWSSRGQLRYKLKGSTLVKKVANVLDTVENILSD